MKIHRYTSAMLLLLLLSTVSCDDYLDQTEYADVSDVNIFSTYDLFTGYIDQCYTLFHDYSSEKKVLTINWGDHMVANKNFDSNYEVHIGDYWALLDRNIYSPFINSEPNNYTGQNTTGIWIDSWYGIRVANQSIEHLDDLVNASEDEKKFIEGQAYFFRAYFHFEIIKFFGGMPYIDFVIASDQKIEYPRETYHENTEKIIEDFLIAAELLPVDWDGPGLEGPNTGRATKGAALAFAAKAALYAGSPLMNGISTGSYTYNKDYMELAAEYAWEVIEIANNGTYELIPFSRYREMFGTIENKKPFTLETIFMKVPTWQGTTKLFGDHGRKFSPSYITPSYKIGGVDPKVTPTQNMIDCFETINGLPIVEDPSYDPMNPWENRDPRFRQNILVDGDLWVKTEPDAYCRLYVGGATKTIDALRTGYLVKKFWPLGANEIDNELTHFTYVSPNMRLAEIYLIYAEAVNEAYGYTGTVPGSSLTAIEAVNILRARPELDMPPVNSRVSSDDDMREIVWNERAVELCFENHRWFDLRRWRVAHLLKYRELYDLLFDEEYTYFNRVLIETIAFEDKHYWVPIPREDTYLYTEFYQNPGW